MAKQKKPVEALLEQLHAHGLLPALPPGDAPSDQQVLAECVEALRLVRDLLPVYAALDPAQRAVLQRFVAQVADYGESALELHGMRRKLALSADRLMRRKPQADEKYKAIRAKADRLRARTPPHNLVSKLVDPQAGWSESTVRRALAAGGKAGGKKKAPRR